MAGKEIGARRKQRGFLATTGVVLGLGLIVTSPLILTGCGSGSGNRAIDTVGGGGSLPTGLGRAAKLIGSWKSTRTLASGKVEETTLDFAPASGTETVTGSYTIRVLSPRANGGSDFVSYESGTLTGNILTSGNLHLRFTPDGGKAVKISRASGDSEYAFGSSGKTMQDIITNAVYSAFAQTIQSFQAKSIAGTWFGGPTGDGGFQLIDPVTDSIPKNPATGADLPVVPMTIQYSTTDVLARKYTASVTLADPTTGTPYTATGVTANLYSEYDTQAGTFPKNLPGVVNSPTGSDLFVSGSGVLPASAKSLSLPGIPVELTLAGRAFIFEAGVSTVDGKSGQLGALWLKFDATTDPLLYPLFVKYTHQNTGATQGYIQAGYFYIVKGQSASTGGGTTTDPAVGTIQFSNVVGTNANTKNITKTESTAGFQGAILTATLVETGGGTVERDLNMNIYAPDDASLSVGKTFTIVNTTSSPSAGQAKVQYIETSGQQKFWTATGGTIVVTAHDKDTTTFRVTDATMTALLNAGMTQQPTGSFTINAKGKF